MKQAKPIWITEAEAAAMAGLDPKTFRRYVTDSKSLYKLDIGYTRITKKADPFYNKNDIERLLLERSIQPAA